MLKNTLRQTTKVLSVTSESVIVHAGIIAIYERTNDVYLQSTRHTLTHRHVYAGKHNRGEHSVSDVVGPRARLKESWQAMLRSTRAKIWGGKRFSFLNLKDFAASIFDFPGWFSQVFRPRRDIS